MIISRTNFTQFLEDSNLSYMLQYASWSNGAHTQSIGDSGPMELGVTTLSVIQFLLNMTIIIVLMLNGINKKVKNNSFYFIVNLAATDLVGFILIIVALKIQENSWTYKSSSSDVFSEKMTKGCQRQINLFTFSYLNTVLATVFLTLDRFLFISKPLTYSILVTKTRIRAMILATWIAPGMVTIITNYTARSHTSEHRLVLHHLAAVLHLHCGDLHPVLLDHCQVLGVEEKVQNHERESETK